MVPTPEVLGLSVCERVIIEEGTGDPSLINIFRSKSVENFPSRRPG
jgi:hypothetical protein